MDIKLVIIIVLSIVYGLFELIMSLYQNRQKRIVKSGDRKSLWILTIGITLGYWLSFMIGAIKIGRIQPWNLFFVMGMVFVFVGLIVRVTSIITLKRHFTYTVTTIANHELIEKGLYKWIRHPGYLGQLMIFVGIAASLSNWLSVLFMIIPVFVGYAYRIKVEEHFMIEQFGQNYVDFQQRTKKLIPSIY